MVENGDLVSCLCYHKIKALMKLFVENMKIISAIYLNCHTLLKDDWISKINFEEDLQEGKVCTAKR